MNNGIRICHNIRQSTDTAVREEFLCTHVGLAYAHVGTVSQRCSGT